MNQEPPNNSGAQIIGKIFTAVIVTIIAAVFVLILWWWFTPPQGVVEADEGFKKAKVKLTQKNCALGRLKKFQKSSARIRIHLIQKFQYI
jgi:beta-lactam-binding protein with PASTA domain